jgi:hypothetical protein
MDVDISLDHPAILVENLVGQQFGVVRSTQ